MPLPPIEATDDDETIADKMNPFRLEVSLYALPPDETTDVLKVLPSNAERERYRDFAERIVGRAYLSHERVLNELDEQAAARGLDLPWEEERSLTGEALDRIRRGMIEQFIADEIWEAVRATLDERARRLEGGHTKGASTAHPVPDIGELKTFLVSKYKHDRLYGRGDEYGDTVVRSRLEDLGRNGYDLISHHESKTGEVVYYRFDGTRLAECEPPPMRPAARSEEGARA